MERSVTKGKYITWYTLLMLVCGWGGYFILHHLCPDWYFTWYPAIPLWFYLFGWIYISIVDSVRKKAESKRLFLVYMGMKGFKLLTSLCIMLTYVLAVQIQKKEFLISYFLFYIISMIFETVFFSHFEKELKANQKIQNEINKGI